MITRRWFASRDTRSVLDANCANLVNQTS